MVCWPCLGSGSVAHIRHAMQGHVPMSGCYSSHQKHIILPVFLLQAGWPRDQPSTPPSTGAHAPSRQPPLQQTRVLQRRQQPTVTQRCLRSLLADVTLNEPDTTNSMSALKRACPMIATVTSVEYGMGSSSDRCRTDATKARMCFVLPCCMRVMLGHCKQPCHHWRHLDWL